MAILNGTGGEFVYGHREREDNENTPISKSPEKIKIDKLIGGMMDFKTKAHNFNFDRIGDAQYERTQGSYDHNSVIELPENSGFIVRIMRGLSSGRLYFTSDLEGQQLLRPLENSLTLENIKKELENLSNTK